MIFNFINSTTSIFFLFFYNDSATSDIYTLSLHDALPISLHAHGPGKGSPNHPQQGVRRRSIQRARFQCSQSFAPLGKVQDRKSTRLNSSHVAISYAVFCLKKKKKHLKI